MTFKEVLRRFRSESFNEKDKGTKFERLMRAWLLSDPRYSELSDVWMWEGFPSRKDFGGKDVGIDLVAKTDLGDYWAIQCKCYTEDTYIDKPMVDSFLATSSRTFKDELTLKTVGFSNRIWISTTPNWGTNAEEAIQNQNPPVTRIGLVDLESSPVDWEKLLKGLEGKDALQEGKKPFKHQLEAISLAAKHYVDEGNERGKLIMACGTGKTYTSLLIAENILDQRGLVLFMVPSISLLGQSLNSWAADAKKPIKAVCICSDAKVSKKIQQELDASIDSSVDLALPATTDAKSVMRQLLKYRNHDGLVVVFSTYQSIDAVSEAQQTILRQTDGEFGTFDFIICDEAHRTTGVKVSTQDESNFTKIHNDEFISGKRRLYMTATPRLYGQSAKIKASEKDCILCSMDDESIYGKEFYRVNFSYAVSNGLLTDYKVLVLTVNENDVPDNIKKDITGESTKEYNYDDVSKLIGVINGLSKVIKGDDGRTWNADPVMMHRALAFCSKIGKTDIPGSSRNVAAILPKISEKYNSTVDKERFPHIVDVTARHIDGSMNSQERNKILGWLSETPDNPDECRVVTNVRCLSEGVDVPSLDAVLFLSARNSQVDVVQSVGRVMRNFHKGQADEKKYGYIIIPVVVPENVKPEDALDDNKTFEVVWKILNALRSHDDHFNAEVQKLSLNKKKNGSKVLIGGVGIGVDGYGGQDDRDAMVLEDVEVARQLELRFGTLQEGMYAKLVEKCGDRMYWENWAKEVGVIAQKFIERITRLVIKEGKHRREFDSYLKGLQKNLNPSVDEAQAIEMLAQHMITRPVFDALFADYQFVKNNAVSRSMQEMIDILHEEAFEKDTAVLDKFYESVRVNVGSIDNLEGKQTVIKNLYEKFFKGAFPKTVDKLGIVYTPVECVDFIIRSVNDILKSEFNTSLTEKNVHILDPFTGTGTFITRLLQLGVIKPEDLERKYRNEIHCNEIVLLAYYIADVNIESVFHDLTRREQYLQYDGICLTDTFQLSEDKHNELFSEVFQENSDRVRKQQETPVRVIIGNPPYSVGQDSADDNAKNLSYPNLEARIAATYVRETSDKGRTVQSLYDSYIKAFRWASDRIPEDEGGIVAYISNGAWLDSNSGEGFRRCLEKEFSTIYVLNLRGNQRTSGELSRKEGGKIFGSGSRTPISITILVKNPAKKGDKATIYYYDIGDYLTREQKLKMVKEYRNASKIEWRVITPNEKADWVNQRDDLFDNYIILGNKAEKQKVWFSIFSAGDITHRDVWCYNSSKSVLQTQLTRAIDYYNTEKSKAIGCKNPDEVTSAVDANPTRIKWDLKLYQHALKGIEHHFEEDNVRLAAYRPFFKQWLYYDTAFNWSQYQLPKLFPTKNAKNLLICVSGIGVTKDFSCIITDTIPDLELIGKSQCFPMYWYEENTTKQWSLFDEGVDEDYFRKDAITDWILKEVRSRFGGSKSLTKEHIFFYLYGILHSSIYRQRFSAHLKKSLPRIPIVDSLEDFLSFYKAGRQLADLHLNYETVESYDGVTVLGDRDASAGYDYFRVEKMKFPSKGQKDTIIYNGNIRIEGIPARAYEYIVNGKSALEWILERYAVTVDGASQIKNDPNDWAKEHGKPRYILDLILSVINVSVQTVDIVNSLPTLKFD